MTKYDYVKSLLFIMYNLYALFVIQQLKFLSALQYEAYPKTIWTKTKDMLLVLVWQLPVRVPGSGAILGF